MARIQQVSTYIGELLDQARRGELVPASFQRPYRWSQNDVEEMWTSINEDCPIGMFLIWQPHKSVNIDTLKRHRLGPIAVSEDTRPSLILDGQNRLASFAWSMLRPDDTRPHHAELSEDEAATWESGKVLVADADEERVHFVDRERADGPHMMPAGIVGQTVLYNQAVRKKDPDGTRMSDKALDWFDLLGSRIRKVRTVVTLLEGCTAEEAFRHFKRISRSGVAMSDDDLARSIGLAENVIGRQP